jgi:glutathione synthase
MLHHDLATNDYQIKQVELNTVSASFACLSTVITKVHQFLSDRYDFYNDADAETLDIQRHSLPNNSALQGLSQGIYEAWKLYGNVKAYVLFVVQPAERNVFDQRLIEYELFEKFKVKCIRRTLFQVGSSVKKFTPGDPLIVE